MPQGVSEPRLVLGREDGIAMLTVLMLTIILTIIGLAAITTTILDIKMAGGERLRENSLDAAEACLSSGVQIIQQTMVNSSIPTTLTGPGANPSITLPLGTGVGQNPLEAEILGQSDGNSDSADPSVASIRNAVLTMSNYTVNMDIDRLYAKPVSGGSIAYGAGYGGTGAGASGGGVQLLYRIDCRAYDNTGVTGTTARVTGVYACLLSGATCQRKY
jgi:Tfp pilus assembly protein PilX